ncbi:hypothetical protein [Mesorhizobium sp.]|nr:hypothetical protein [Mesorhizobium sp.]
MSVKWDFIGAIRAQGENSIWSATSSEATLQTAKSGKAVAIEPKLGSMN